MKIPVFQVPLFSQQEIAEKPFKIYRGIVYSFQGVLVICTYQGISEIPGMICKHVIVNIESDRPQVLDKEYGRSTCIALAKRMNLPEIRNELCNMGDDNVVRQSLITETMLLFQVVIHCPPQIFPIQITYGIAVKYPLLFGYVVFAYLPCMLEYAGKDSPVDGNIAVRTEIKCMG
jgi:hypothetical protein